MTPYIAIFYISKTSCLLTEVMTLTLYSIQVLDLMGVSKPILNYVVFCHQEDSNWPLDIGSRVKDKFDEIFASDKYKACLKKIKDVRADHKSDEKRDKGCIDSSVDFSRFEFKFGSDVNHQMWPYFLTMILQTNGAQIQVLIR